LLLWPASPASRFGALTGSHLKVSTLFAIADKLEVVLVPKGAARRLAEETQAAAPQVKTLVVTAFERVRKVGDD
jgi:hypothetical protein